MATGKLGRDVFAHNCAAWDKGVRDGDQVTLKSDDGATWTWTVNSDTTVFRDGTKGSGAGALKKGETATKEDILGFMQGKIAKWWMPDDVAFVSEIPHTATGKIQKMTLRQQFKDYHLPSSEAAE